MHLSTNAYVSMRSQCLILSMLFAGNYILLPRHVAIWEVFRKNPATFNVHYPQQNGTPPKLTAQPGFCTTSNRRNGPVQFNSQTKCATNPHCSTSPSRTHNAGYRPRTPYTDVSTMGWIIASHPGRHATMPMDSKSLAFPPSTNYATQPYSNSI